MQKVRKLPTESPIMFWLEFINNPDSKKIEHMYGTEAVYQEARMAYHRAIAAPEVQELLRIRDKAEKDYLDALARRQEKGKKLDAEKERKKAKAGKIETAKKLLTMGLSVDQITEATGLPLEEVREL